MILRVILKNFLSFEKEEQFDMFPNLKRVTLSNHINYVQDKLPVLKMAAIYGSNGAGKSNLLKGVNFLKEFTTNRRFVDNRSILNYFYGLKKDVGSQPIELAIEFVTKAGLPFLYDVEIGKTGVRRELLQVSGLGESDNTPIFSREVDKLQQCAVSPSSDVMRMIEGWMAKNPFSSLLTINDDMPVLVDDNISAAHKWFEDELELVGLHSFNPGLINMFKNGKRLNSFACDLFKSIDLGISGVKVKTEDFDEWMNTHDVGKFPVDEIKKMRSGVLSEMVEFRNTYAVTVEKGVQKISQMIFEQFGKDGFSRDMDIKAQSDGTVRLLSLVPSLYNAIKNGKTVIIDELDHSIHPHLVREIVRYFSTHKTNGQLIFTTHQTCLLNQEFIRTDEVWLVEKKEGCSHMYSLNDFKIHNTINIENGYMEGRYGAIPFIGEIKI